MVLNRVIQSDCMDSPYRPQLRFHGGFYLGIYTISTIVVHIVRVGRTLEH